MKTDASKNPASSILLFAFALTILSALLVAAVAQETTTSSVGKPEEFSLEERMKQPITHKCTNVSIDLVLLQLAELANVDIIKSKDVTGDVTFKVTNVPLEEVLRNILAAHGWGYIQTKNMIRVVPIKEIQEIEREEREAEEKKAILPVVEKIVTKTYAINFVDPAEVAKALKIFVSKEYGAVLLIPGSSNIMVTDRESRVEGMDKFIEEIDCVTPQVLIEVQIYDLTHKNQLDLGIDWNVGRNTVFDSEGNPVGGRLTPFAVAGFAGGEKVTETSMEAMIRFGILNESFNMDALIEAQEEILDAVLLANPRLQVLNGQLGSFKGVTEIPYQQETTTSMGGAMASTAFKDVGVSLDVTPYITSGGEMVRLHVLPEFGVLVHKVEEGPPTIDTRKVETTLLVKNGQTIVIGGLRKKETRKTVQKIPLLGDIPLLGLLFRTEGSADVYSELVIFITPKVIKEPALSVLSKSEIQDLKEATIESFRKPSEAQPERFVSEPEPSEPEAGKTIKDKDDTIEGPESLVPADKPSQPAEEFKQTVPEPEEQPTVEPKQPEPEQPESQKDTETTKNGGKADDIIKKIDDLLEQR